MPTTFCSDHEHRADGEEDHELDAALRQHARVGGEPDGGEEHQQQRVLEREVERELQPAEAVGEREQDRHQAAADHRRGDAEALQHPDVRHQRAAGEQHDHRHEDRVDEVELDAHALGKL